MFSFHTLPSTLMLVLMSSYNLYAVDDSFVVLNSPTDGDEGCQYLLESFARVSANFTFCAIRYARPIRLCESCIKAYLDVLGVHDDILKLEDEGGEACRDQLINLDRLQVVEAGFQYISGLWNRANCNGCYNLSPDSCPTGNLTDATEEILKLSSALDDCIAEHRNDTGAVVVYDPAVCLQCKAVYVALNDRYNQLKQDRADGLLCMDIVDLINTTRSEWSSGIGCCLEREKPEVIFLVAAAIVALLPIVFYITTYKFSSIQQQTIAQQKRWVEHTNVPSSSGEVVRRVVGMVRPPPL